jgi:hypothetical protein
MPLAYYLYRDVFRGKGGSVPRIDGEKIPCIVATCPYSIGRANRASVSPRSSSSSSSSRCGNVRSQEGADNRYILLTVDAAACSLLSRSLYCEIGDSTQFDSLLLHSEGVVSNASEDLNFWYFCFLTLSFDFIDSQFSWGRYIANQDSALRSRRLSVVLLLNA